MTGQERKEKILAILEESKTASVSMLAEEFSVSEKTIRRDLTALEEKGLLVRTRGGAMTPEASQEGSQLKLELPVESLDGASEEKDSKSATNNEPVIISEQIHPGVVIKTSRPEWIVRAIEKARPGTIVEPTHSVIEREETPATQDKKETPVVQNKKETPTVQEKKETSFVQKKSGVLATKAPESTSEEVEIVATDEAKESEKAPKAIDVIEVGETIKPEVLEGLIKLAHPKSQEESAPPSKEEKPEKIKSVSPEEIPAKEEQAPQEKDEKQPPKERVKKPAKPPEPVKEKKIEESKRQKRPSKKAREDRHKKASLQGGSVKSIRKNQKQKSEEPKETSKLRSVFDIIHILLAVICFIGGTILAIYILQTNRNQNVEIPEDNGRHEMIICEDLNVNSDMQEHMLIHVGDDTVVRVDI